MFDMLGGSNMARRKRNKQAIYKPRGLAAAVVPPPVTPAPVDATRLEA
jgi:hypothetical protein